jgi:hypothetical protein
MAYQDAFWKGQSVRTNNRDKIRGNPEAKPMHKGPGEFDEDMGTGADAPKLGSSQPRSKGPGARSDELPLKHAHTQPKRRAQHQVLMAHALRMHMGNQGMSDDGTTMGTAVGGGAAGGGAGGA